MNGDPNSDPNNDPNNDPRAALAAAPMRRLQIVVVALCIALNALDGFDVLAISFAAPGIAAEWGINRATLGVVLSMELFGMAAGSVLIGNVADRIGRRPTILACLVVMATGMLLASAASGVTMLSITRLVTGLGIGGMLSSTSAIVAEFSNARRRGLNVTLNIAGYSTGAILGGVVASALLAESGNWRMVFAFGGIMTAVSLPLAFFLLPESIESLIARRPHDALDRINRILAKLGLEPIETLPTQSGPIDRPSIAALFSRGYAGVTLLLTVAYFAQIMLFYYIQKWIPKVVVDLGFEPATAGAVLVSANIGNLLGAVAIALATQRFSLRPLIVGSMLAGFAAIAVFGLGFHSLVRLSLVAMIAGFFINAGVVGLYPILAQIYPATLRASGIGFVIGVGRGGSAMGPMVAGALFTGGAGLLLVSLTMGAGALIAATMLLLLPRAQAQIAERAVR
jgi:benzoate transport